MSDKDKTAAAPGVVGRKCAWCGERTARVTSEFGEPICAACAYESVTGRSLLEEADE